MTLIEKKTCDWWTIRQRWAAVEHLTVSGMTVTKYCKDRAQHGQNLDWQHVSEWKDQYENDS